MVKEVKSSLELDDLFIVERNGINNLVSGSDLRDFIEASQDRFTDDAEEAIQELNELALENTDLIRENDLNNRLEHALFEIDIRNNTQSMLQNRSDLNQTIKRVSKLEKDNRTFGYYSFAWKSVAQPDTSLPATPPPGFFIFLDKNNKMTTDPEECVQVFFNSVDMAGRSRTFLGIYSGDSLELSFQYITDEGYENEGRLSFRVSSSHDSAAQLGNESIKVDVRLVNIYDPQNTYTANDYDEDGNVIKTTTYQGLRMVDKADFNIPYDNYVQCSAYPSLLVDEKIDVSTLYGAVLPRGAITLWTTDDIPEGWLLCDGRNRSQSKTGLNADQQLDVDNLFNEMGFDKLPGTAGRFPAGITSNYAVSGRGQHEFHTIGGHYWRRTGAPYNNNGNEKEVTLVNDGEHNHDVDLSANTGHKHKYGSNDQHTSGNGTNVYDARTRGNKMTSSEVGDHNHNMDVVAYTTNHNHKISGFNDDHRPYTYTMNYIIKYTT